MERTIVSEDSALRRKKSMVNDVRRLDSSSTQQTDVLKKRGDDTNQNSICDVKSRFVCGGQFFTSQDAEMQLGDRVQKGVVAYAIIPLTQYNKKHTIFVQSSVFISNQCRRSEWFI